MRIRLTLIILALALAALLLVVNQLGMRDRTETLPGSQPTVTAPRVLPLYWEIGETRAFEVAVDSTIALDLGVGPAGAPIAQRVAGTLVLRVLEANPAEVATVFLFHEEGPEDDATSADPMIVQFERSGRPASFRFKTTTRLPAEERRRQENLLRTFQVVLGPDPTQGRWETEERDGSGVHRACYQLDATGRVVRKSKTDYRLDDEAPRDAFSPFPEAEIRVFDSVGTFAWDSTASWLESATVTEDVEFRSRAGQSIRVRLEGSLRPAPVPFELLVLLPESVAQFDAPAELAIPGAAPPTLSTMGPAGTEERADFLRHLAVVKSGPRPRLRNLLALTEALRLHPELATEIGKALRDRTLDGGTTAALVQTLAQADNEAASRELAMLLDDAAVRGALRGQAARAAAGMSRPEASLLDSLWRAAGTVEDGELASSAGLALGALARNLNENGDPRGPAISGRLRDELSTSLESTRQAALLIAIGNTKDRASREVVAARLEDDSILVRSAAAQALRATAPDDAASILARSLETESSAPVRAALVGSLVKLESVDVAVLRQVDRRIRGEPDAGVRAAMARLLANHLDDLPDGRTTLIELVRTDSDPGVRRAAARALRSRR